MIAKLILFTNRNCVALDEDGELLLGVQEAISYSRVDPDRAREIIGAAEKLYLADFHNWEHEISKVKMRALLGLNEDQDEKGMLTAIGNRPGDAAVLANRVNIEDIREAAARQTTARESSSEKDNSLLLTRKGYTRDTMDCKACRVEHGVSPFHIGSDPKADCGKCIADMVFEKVSL